MNRRLASLWTAEPERYDIPEFLREKTAAREDEKI